MITAAVIRKYKSTVSSSDYLLKEGQDLCINLLFLEVQIFMVFYVRLSRAAEIESQVQMLQEEV